MKKLDIELQLDDNTGDNIDSDMNIIATQEHVSDIERAIRLIKERYSCMWHRFPYKAIPKRMIIAAAKLISK